ncbi:MAG: GNAT family N-acetyltransferase [Xanthomonadales bacterium]|nr:GNAT family N-acetyltransferase [Gammaproteobacteria bacterium]MBT8054880.1 GNAT family N-acetyltransferase [Gammaproteobacteria bacterium]NND58189.1 GNAT family N-acetyltransferase [Xanthomonadales bacterium]NNK50046.1 GNAT family N-acetyltransferase [Xanthomonadales bacterium]
MIRTELETVRLRLRHFTPADLQAMYELNSDPDVIRYAEATPARNLQEAGQRLAEGPLSDYRKYGYGRFAVEWKGTGQVIGFCGIKYLPEIELPEIGYRYLKKFWGQGIGTEAAKVCVDFARDDLEIQKLVALIAPENKASIRIAVKLGMTRGPLIHIYDTDAYQYEMLLAA